MTKLTLSMDEEVVAKAKKLAKANGTSVSKMIRNFVICLSNGRTKRIPIGPLTRKASGLGRLPKGKDLKKLREDAMLEKYGSPE